MMSSCTSVATWMKLEDHRHIDVAGSDLARRAAGKKRERGRRRLPRN